MRLKWLHQIDHQLLLFESTARSWNLLLPKGQLLATFFQMLYISFLDAKCPLEVQLIFTWFKCFVFAYYTAFLYVVVQPEFF
jgi:hypothetical protein